MSPRARHCLVGLVHVLSSGLANFHSTRMSDIQSDAAVTTDWMDKLE